MAEQPFTSPVQDSVPEVNHELAVGEDLAFQRRWWRFERVIWAFFLLVIIADLLGLFGRGWLAQATIAVPDGTLSVDYERIERTNTPTSMTLHFSASAIRNGQVTVTASESIVDKLGAQRVAPQPASSTIGASGITYVFPATTAPATVRIQLQPAAPGLHRFRLQVPGEPAIQARVLVMP